MLYIDPLSLSNPLNGKFDDYVLNTYVGNASAVSPDNRQTISVHKSLREFPLITAYSHAQIADHHNAVASFISQNQQNGPHAVEKPIQNYRCSDDSIPQAVLPQYFYVAYVIFVAHSAVGSSSPLKLVRQINLSSVFHSVTVLFNQIAYVFLGVVVVQSTQQDQTIEQADLFLAPNGAQVYLIPLDASSVMGEQKKFCFEISND
ncbi:MAG: hypothetical protein EZS28_044410 [Streblomastix strix]|uniref:Uncharacterized protein n=1 Tax=Streblomastix strix TaxID=222440 RepID=A0A5J4TQ82_9EUKA|nr:MAG: hypothetical protein EZS28_044410 [Streblomastix strix]